MARTCPNEILRAIGYCELKAMRLVTMSSFDLTPNDVGNVASIALNESRAAPCYSIHHLLQEPKRSTWVLGVLRRCAMSPRPVI